ncbi:MAG: hypothetical protein F6K28_25125 [Microcoleus sp. SIO2G3]|nr:hypothetical protein [Microcoleus sp. SIO2G3]
MKRPLGVTLIAILNLLAIAVLGLVLLFVLSVNWSDFPPDPDADINPAPAYPTASTDTNIVLAVVGAAIPGSILLLLAYGLLTLRRWAWMGELMLVGLVAAIQIRSIAFRTFDRSDVIGLVIQIVVLAYLLQPQVRRKFH